jgi:hypothetical protein
MHAMYRKVEDIVWSAVRAAAVREHGSEVAIRFEHTGKTSIVEDAAAALGVQCLTVALTLFDPVDLNN